MGIKLRLNKGTESIGVGGNLLSNVTGKITLRTPFGNREVAPDGSLMGGKVKVESTLKPTSKPKKGSK